jgi:hypothetical protein
MTSPSFLVSDCRLSKLGTDDDQAFVRLATAIVVGLLAAAQAVEHYEITPYGTLIDFESFARFVPIRDVGADEGEQCDEGTKTSVPNRRLTSGCSREFS